jgi:hypothetical protein
VWCAFAGAPRPGSFSPRLPRLFGPISMFRIPVTLVFEDGETRVENLYFPKKPTAGEADQVWKAAVELGKSKGAKHVLVPPPWGKP